MQIKKYHYIILFLFVLFVFSISVVHTVLATHHNSCSVGSQPYVSSWCHDGVCDAGLCAPKGIACDAGATADCAGECDPTSPALSYNGYDSLAGKCFLHCYDAGAPAANCTNTAPSTSCGTTTATRTWARSGSTIGCYLSSCYLATDTTCVASGCSNTGSCSSGACQVPASGADPNNACGTLSCSGYYWGWSGSTCYYRANVSDNSCNGSGSCKSASDVCSSQGKGTEYYTCPAGNEPTSGTCTGTTAGTCQLAPAFSLDPNDSSYNYGNVNVGSSSDKTYTVKNSGGGYLIGGASVSGTGFACTGTCTDYSLSANATKSYTIRFSPGSAGSKTGSVQFTSAPGRTVNLSGVGVAPDSTPPTVTVNASPASVTTTWQSTNATATIDCSDASGCETNTNWQYSTPTSNPGICSSIGGYTAYNGSGIFITDHRWVCAKAKDNAGITGYSTPVEFKVDEIRPTSTISSPIGGAWFKTDFMVNVGDTDTGGSGFFIDGGRYHVFERVGINPWVQTITDTQRPLSGGQTIAVGPTVTNGCSKEGPANCKVQVFARDQAGNAGRPTIEGNIVTVGIDFTPPTVGLISPTNAVTNIATALSASVSDATSDLDYCSLVVNGVIQAGTMTISGGTASKSYTFAGTYPVHATCYDNAGNATIGTNVTVTVSDPVLTFPSGTWQRLWYSTSGASPSFLSGNFLGEGPDESIEKFTTDWDGDSTIIAYGRFNNIGFKSSRTIDFTSKGGNYVFTVGSDDGVRLSIDGNVVINQWGDGSYRTSSATVDMVAASHTFLLEYYENGGNAKISFAYALAPCAKSTNIPKTNLSITIPSGPATGGSKSCNILLDHFGGDRTDGLPVSYETLSTALQTRSIGMSDNIATCNNNLKFHTWWGSPYNPTHNFWTTSVKDDYSATHILYHGYQILTDTVDALGNSNRTCVVQNFEFPSCNLICPVPAKTDRSFTASLDWPNDVNVTFFSADFNLVECTSNAHCAVGGNSDANANTAKCNVGITNNFSQNTCIDSVAPTITVGGIRRTYDPDVGSVNVPLGTAGAGQWLKSGIYEISVTFADTHPFTSGEDTSYRAVVIRSKGPDNIWENADDKVYGTTRTADNKFSVWVGPASNPSNNCVDEQPERCRVRVFASDLAGNVVWTDIFLNIDYTRPTAQ